MKTSKNVPKTLKNFMTKNYQEWLPQIIDTYIFASIVNSLVAIDLEKYFVTKVIIFYKLL